jgi:hypothetical protein
MVSNHYISAILRFSNAVVCPFRNILVVDTNTHNTNLCEMLQDESVVSLDDICSQRTPPIRTVAVDQWTTLHLEEGSTEFSPVALTLYRQRLVCGDPNNIFSKTEVGVTDRGFYCVPVYCALDVEVFMSDMLGVTIHKDGESIPVMSSQILPVISVSTSPNYASGYLHGGNYGVYLERHSTPHIHRPSDCSSGGAIVLAKETLLQVGEYATHSLQLFGVRIPHKHTLLIPPSVWHNDCYLSGTYQVGYTVSKSFETVALAHRLGFVQI